MSDEEKFEQFMQRVMQRPLPPIDNPLARIRTFAKELAEGAIYEVWDLSLHFRATHRMKFNEVTYDREGGFADRFFPIYLYKRWAGNCPRLELLAVNNFIELKNEGIRITKIAFDLVNEVQPSKIFISYSRNDSSAFALFIRARLKDRGVGDAFIDMTIPAGDDWEARIRHEIENRDNFILLLGEKTLNSDNVRKEILWAIEFKRLIIPVWHNAFKVSKLEPSIEPQVKKIVRAKNAIRVLEESASGYEKAIVELLNHFGITP